MRDYHPLDIAKACNVGVRFIGPQAKPFIGKQVFHGLPFRIASSERRCLIGFGGRGGSRRPVMLRIGKKARWVIFAHALLESAVREGENVGRTIAHYAFRFHDGKEEVVPVRERFEINIVPTDWGQWAFLAVPDQKPRLFDRDHGRWGEAGRRRR